jgi:DNA (cytosine-5)-methyltransferase 1
MREFTFYEFFAGGGMTRAGLGPGWRCLFANDFDPRKVATYTANWGGSDIRDDDVANLTLADLPGATVDLSWASFPCQDLSLAGSYRGLGRERDNERTRSGTFWPFWKLMRGLVETDRAPRTIVLENVHGCLTSHGGKDFGAIASALAQSNYTFGATVINAERFVPQSRPRVFFIAVRKDTTIPPSLVASSPRNGWHPPALIEAQSLMTPEAKRNWVWWNLPEPGPRNVAFADLIEDEPTGVEWHAPSQTRYILDLMSDVNRKKVADAAKAGRRMVGGLYRRTRPDGHGVSRQRAEVRFDEIAGCLRTPAGGSSRQTILVVDGTRVRSRLLSPREAARLMGLHDGYVLPRRYNDAYHVCGDGVCVPVVRHVAAHVLEPLLSAVRIEPMAAE